jgi:nucleoside phosphorylase
MKKIWIITAMEPEAQIIIDFLWLELSKSYKNIKIYEKDWYTLASTWMWKIQASIWSTILCADYWIDCLVNIWVAWNLNGNNVRIWNVFLIKEIIQHDMYLPLPWDLEYAKWKIKINFESWINPSEFNFWFHENGICVTWDQFIDDTDKCNQLKNNTWADIAEMEAYAVASVAREFWILDNTVIIKSISDWANNDACGWLYSNLEFAMNNSIEILKKILKI